MKIRVILDTNMLLVPVQFNVDIFDEIEKLVGRNYQLIVLDSVIRELERIAKSNKKDAKAAKVALQLLEDKEFVISKTKEKSTDKAIVKLTDDNTIVATNDKLLRQKLKNKNIKTIYLRSKKYLEMG